MVESYCGPCPSCGEADCAAHHMNISNSSPDWRYEPSFQGILEDCARRRRAYKLVQEEKK